MRTRLPAILLVLGSVTSCSDAPRERAEPTASPSPSTPPSVYASPSVSPSPTPAPTVDPGPPWPRVGRGPAPAALGAVRTLRVARTSSGGTLAANLVLPRMGGNASAPLVLTPCGRRVTLRQSDVTPIRPGSGGALPKAAKEVLVLLDPGHGGPASGAAGSKGIHEKTRNLQIALEVRKALRGRVGTIVMTRDRDFDASLEFRVALADALRADVAVSVHLNAEPDVTGRATPGLETYASVADPAGRRLAGVIYESQRRYLDTLGGPWAADRDAGAKYRLSSKGTDYYGLLRRGHRPWVISESMFLSEPREEALVARPEIRAGLGEAIADGIVAFTQTRAPGSGWVRPLPRPASDGGGRGGTTCVEPTR